MKTRENRQLTAAEKRALGATAGLTVTRYAPDGDRAEIRQLAPDFARRSPNDTDASEGEPT